MRRGKKVVAWNVCDTGIEIVIGSPLSVASENANGTPWYLLCCLAEPEKSTKKPLPYAWLAVKPNNILSRVGMSVKRKGSYMSRLPFIGFPVEMNERKMLLSFFTISRKAQKECCTT